MEIPLTDQERASLRHEYEDNQESFMKFAVGTVVLALVIMFVPTGCLPRRRFHRHSHMDGSLNMVQSLGVVWSLVFVVGIFGGFLAFLYFKVYNLRTLSKDIDEGVKIQAIVKVDRVEKVPDHIVKEVYGLYDTILHFEPNEYKIKELPVLSTERPEMIRAKEICIVQLKHSKTMVENYLHS